METRFIGAEIAIIIHRSTLCWYRS